MNACVTDLRHTLLMNDNTITKKKNLFDMQMLMIFQNV